MSCREYYVRRLDRRLVIETDKNRAQGQGYVCPGILLEQMHNHAAARHWWARADQYSKYLALAVSENMQSFVCGP